MYIIFYFSYLLREVADIAAGQQNFCLDAKETENCDSFLRKIFISRNRLFNTALCRFVL